MSNIGTDIGIWHSFCVYMCVVNICACAVRIMLDAKTDIFLDDGEKLKRTFGKKKNRREEEDSELAGVE